MPEKRTEKKRGLGPESLHAGEVEGEGPSNRPLALPPKWKPVPTELYSAYTANPFAACSSCDSEFDEHCVYEVQKVFRGDEVIFEMAICHTCGETICQEFSDDSLKALKGFLLCNYSPGVNARHCNFCGLPRALLERFTLIGACQEDWLLLPPFVLCDKCSESLEARISPRTREVQEDFLRLNFPGVPGSLDLSPSLGGFLG